MTNFNRLQLQVIFDECCQLFEKTLSLPDPEGNVKDPIKIYICI